MDSLDLNNISYGGSINVLNKMTHKLGKLMKKDNMINKSYDSLSKGGAAKAPSRSGRFGMFNNFMNEANLSKNIGQKSLLGVKIPVWPLMGNKLKGSLGLLLFVALVELIIFIISVSKDLGKEDDCSAAVMMSISCTLYFSIFVIGFIVWKGGKNLNGMMIFLFGFYSAIASIICLIAFIKKMTSDEGLGDKGGSNTGMWILVWFILIAIRVLGFYLMISGYKSARKTIKRTAGVIMEAMSRNPNACDDWNGFVASADFQRSLMSSLQSASKVKYVMDSVLPTVSGKCPSMKAKMEKKWGTGNKFGTLHKNMLGVPQAATAAAVQQPQQMQQQMQQQIPQQIPQQMQQMQQIQPQQMQPQQMQQMQPQ
jgi:hypothetical protein